MNRIFIGVFMAIAGTLCSHAEIAADVDRYQAGSQYYAYPVTDENAPVLSSSPEGYEPFHIEHYGRHGSRWLTADELYLRPVDYLRQADMKGKLTERGRLLLKQLIFVSEAAKNKAGELTPLGHRQHRQIARRMVKNFPEIYRAGNYVNANSTVVIRCILSMASEIAELKAIEPGLNVKCDASMETQNTLNYNHLDIPAQQLIATATSELSKNFSARPRDISSFTELVFNDAAWAKDSIDSRSVFKSVFEVAVNAQSHDNLYDLYDFFTPGELRDEWIERNAEWYVTACNTPLTSGRVPYSQRYLLRSMIEGADSAIVSNKVGVNLRFGHESVLLPLITLMEINNVDYSTDNIGNLANNWRNFEFFPMASNIQIVFYRPVIQARNSGYRLSSNDEQTGSDILVKILLNEKEVPFPIKTTSYPYYKWDDLRSYYDNKLNGFKDKFQE
ncbi:histidine-type phosphatase [uncultured Duncaniella sp.]|uniref:histidine-type phosphatase n=1 Tax=uncultured Duncaniella sp. TaxID=2768039 RepID=UPI00259CD006|nr:histidine-type phosphatase [uncultured Duncaniella sp.]